MKNIDLTNDEKQRLLDIFTKNCAHTVAHDIEYLAKLKESVFDKIVASENAGVRRLGHYAQILQHFIADCHSGAYNAPTESLNEATSILLYLVNPFDLIPDKDVERGYLDDIYILELGLAKCGGVLQDYMHARGIDNLPQ